METEPEHKTPETTETQDSFATVPEISKEFDILDQKKPEIAISTMSTAEEKKPEAEMSVDKPEQKGELKLNHPKPFTGKREDLHIL